MVSARYLLSSAGLPIDKFSSCSNSDSSLKSASFIIIIAMELSKEQIDQLVDLELRRLDRDYQRTIAADNAMPARVEGTPNIDALIREATEKAGQPELNCSQDLQNEEKAAERSQSGSWDTQSEGADDQPELAGFQRLDDPADDSDQQGSNSMTFSRAALRRSVAGAVTERQGTGQL